MKSIQCIIIDDEPAAREVLQSYIEKVKVLCLVGVFSSALEAHSFVISQKVDVVFLDIKMPEMSGIEFLKSLSRQPFVVFSTAFPDYAVEGFQLNAVDYLLKPYALERFLQAVNKIMERFALVSEPEPFIFLNADKRIHKISISDIYFLEGAGDYIKFHTQEGKLLVLGTISSFAEFLAAKGFLRVHKSYVINVKHIRYIEGNQLEMPCGKVPIGASYKEQILQLIKPD